MFAFKLFCFFFSLLLGEPNLGQKWIDIHIPEPYSACIYAQAFTKRSNNEQSLNLTVSAVYTSSEYSSASATAAVNTFFLP